MVEEIIKQPEYYAARAERLILSDHAAEMIDDIPGFHAGPAALLELGASDDKKAGFSSTRAERASRHTCR